jgi:hypothetical protein
MNDKTTKLTKKVTAIMFALFLLLFIIYKPYEQEFYADTAMKHFFALFDFIFYNTLLIVHEGGHGVCYILHCPEFITVINATFFQLFFHIFWDIFANAKEICLVILSDCFFLDFPRNTCMVYLYYAQRVTCKRQ